MLIEISQSEKDVYHMISHMWNLMNTLNYQGNWGQTHRWRAE